MKRFVLSTAILVFCAQFAFAQTPVNVTSAWEPFLWSAANANVDGANAGVVETPRKMGAPGFVWSGHVNLPQNAGDYRINVGNLNGGQLQFLGALLNQTTVNHAIFTRFHNGDLAAAGSPNNVNGIILDASGDAAGAMIERLTATAGAHDGVLKYRVLIRTDEGDGKWFASDDITVVESTTIDTIPFKGTGATQWYPLVDGPIAGALANMDRVDTTDHGDNTITISTTPASPAPDLSKIIGMGLITTSNTTIAANLYFRQMAIRDVVAPAVPTGLATVGTQGLGVPHQIEVSWTAVAGAAGYNVYRSDTEDGTYVKLNATPVAASPYVDTPVLANRAYFYKVSAVGAAQFETAPKGGVLTNYAPESAQSAAVSGTVVVLSSAANWTEFAN